MFASHLIVDLGLDVAQVSRILGHASPTITLSVYTHLFDNAATPERSASRWPAAHSPRCWTWRRDPVWLGAAANRRSLSTAGLPFRAPPAVPRLGSSGSLVKAGPTPAFMFARVLA